MAEEDYLKLLRYVLTNGYEKNDRTGVGTLSYSGLHIDIDLEDGFPLLTTKHMPFKAIVAELHMFMQGRTDVTNIKIWHSNTTKEVLQQRGLPWSEYDMGPGYGFQWRHFGAKYDGCDKNYGSDGIDQLQGIIDGIKNDKFGRRHIVSAWNPLDIDKMALPPCHCFFQFTVDEVPTGGEGVPTGGERVPTGGERVPTGEEGERGKKVVKQYLNCIVTQRSADLFLGVPFNIASYALLTHYVAILTGTTPKRLVINFGDAHIYKNHIDQVKLQLERAPYPLPSIVITNCNSIDDVGEVAINNYKHHESIKAQMAV